MKKLIIFLALCTVARAVGTVQQTTQQVGNSSIYTISLYWTGDAITGTVPVTLVQAQAIPIVQGYRVITVETVPGSPAPTNNYSVALLDTAGVDVLAGAAANDVSSSTAQSFAGSPTSPPIFGSLSLSITGQSVGGAKGTIFVYLAPFSQVIGLSPTAPSFPAQGANLFYASPNGASGSPGFRAIAVPGDFGANVQGNASKVQLSSGATVSGDCVKFDANGNTVDFGLPCSSLPAGTQTQYLEIKPNTGNNTTFQFQGLPVINVADYNFPAQTNAASLGVGNTTITMAPVPQGVNGTDLYHRLYVSGGTGTAEACLINGGGGTSGQASGSIQLNCGTTHSGAYTISSIDGGIQEAVQAAVSAGGGQVFAPAGVYTSFAALQIQSGVILTGVIGQTVIKPANSVIARNAQWQLGNQAGQFYCVVCVVSGATNVVLRDFTLDENGPNQTWSYMPGDISSFNGNNVKYENLYVKNRMTGGTGVGIAHYDSAHMGGGALTAANNAIIHSSVDAHPSGCTVPNGGGGFYIEGEGTRIISSYVKDICDVGFVSNVCDHCVIADSVVDIGAGQMATPSFSVEGATFVEFNGDQCIATGTNGARYCIGVDSVPTTQTFGTKIIGASCSHCSNLLEIGALTNSNFGATTPVVDTDVIGVHADNVALDCIDITQYAQKVNIIGGDLESCGGAGIQVTSTGSGVGTTVSDVIIDGIKIDHVGSTSIIATNTTTGPPVNGLRVTNSKLGDSNASPRTVHAVNITAGTASDVYIVGNSAVGVTGTAYFYQNTFNNSYVIGPNIGATFTTDPDYGSPPATGIQFVQGFNTGNARGRIQAVYSAADSTNNDWMFLSDNFRHNSNDETNGVIDFTALGTAEIGVEGANAGPGIVRLRAGKVNTAPTDAWLANGLGHVNAPNADAVGTVTLSGGAGTKTFTNAYGVAPVCTCTDQTGANAVKCSTSTTALTITGTTTDVIAYACFGQ